MASLINLNLASFVNCKLKLRYSPLQLSRWGFEYNPETNLIRCCSCCYVIEDIQSAVEMISLKHSIWKPSCLFSKHEYMSKFLKEEKEHAVNNLLKFLMEISGMPRNEHKISGPFGASREFKATLMNLCKYGSKPKSSITASVKVQKRDTVATLNLSYLVKNAKHPIMCSPKERRNTFRGQESKYSHCERAKIEDFVQAGLFFVGREDNVRCFFCGGGLSNIQSDTVPFDVHKKRFPHCQFILYLERNGMNYQSQQQLLQNEVDGMNVQRRTEAQSNLIGLGTSFQSEIRGRRLEQRDRLIRLEAKLKTLVVQDHSREIVERTIEKRFLLTESRSHPLRQDKDFEFEIRGRVLEGREVKARLETPVIQALLSLGYQREHIKNAIERHFLLTGDDFASAAELVQDIFDTEGENGMPVSDTGICGN